MVQDNNHEPNDTNGSRPSDENEKNIIRFPAGGADSRKKMGEAKPLQPPMINLPFFTKNFIALFIAIHLCVWGSGFINPDWPNMIYDFGAFIPASWSGAFPFQWWTPLTLVSFSFLHGGWLHLGMNVIMMAAFGAGIEKWLGPKRFLLLFAGSTVAAIFVQFAISPSSPAGIIGASGAISGFFGGLLIMMKEQRALGNQKNSILPFVIGWVAISVVFGLMGAPDGSPIAWFAHIGGFFGGLGITWWMRRPQSPPPQRPTLH